VLIGALVGAGVTLAVTAVASAKHGEKEGGEFCYNCLARWSAVSVPIGSGIGALVGFAAARSHPSLGPGSRLPAGIAVKLRF